MFGFFGFVRDRKAKQLEKQSEMVRVALNSVLRRRGIATQSIGCDVVALSRPGTSSVMLVHLLIRTWDERLINEAVDIENELFDVISLYSRSEGTSDYLFAWKFTLDKADAGKASEAKARTIKSEPNSATSDTALPPKLMAVPSPMPAVKFDLPKTDLDLDDDAKHWEYGFPATVIRHP